MVIIQYDHDNSFPLSTLGANTAILGATKIDSTRLNGFRIAKVRITAAITGKTTAEGPIAWGLCCNLTAARLKAIIEADPQASTEDDEHGSGEWLMHMGMMTLATTAGPLTGGLGGPNVAAQHEEHKINWSVIAGKSFDLWAYNMSGSPLTTGAIIQSFQEIFGVWLRD